MVHPQPDPPAPAAADAPKPPSPKPAANHQQPVDHVDFQSRLSSPPYRLTDPRWDHIVIALKSGIEVAADKVPIQLATFLQGVKNIWLFGDGVMRVGDYEMVDVVTGTYDAAVKRLEKQGRLEAARAWSPMKVKYEEEQKKKKQQKKKEQKNGGKLVKRDVSPTQESPLSVRLEKRAKTDIEVKPDQESMGWKNDAHKNIPAIRELVNRYPGAEWYVMIDDDTYVFMENLNRVLHPLNPDEPHYLGAPNTFRDCDGVTEMGDGPLFNHGGSGIVLSRGAAREMLKIVDECIVRYHDCFAGDVRLGLCLRDAGILANYKYPGRRWFNPVTPHWTTHPYYDDPCKRVVTFHHLSKATMQKLYDIERYVHNRTISIAARHARDKLDLVNPTTTPHLFFSNGTQPNVFSHLSLPPHLPSPFSAPIHLEDMWYHFVDTDAQLPDIEHGIARAGEQYLVYTGTKDAKHCRWLCSREERCVAWHFIPNGRCEVKDSVTRPIRTRGHASGLIKGRFRCKARTY
ncbi:hypothetical protein BCR44DRAFT_118307 [Catenaria anguillulae PL171]|uniref:N-acetylgalactosaminide beta-1,3-galactosyltransferase n=1 Tax=Catenaria anguillulae PL171 TaxID=765915 RepID=A0A1Y2HH43_9FUNG|nr:hypothetical protein BCR44DRAFT_118307 [Catenaria anguillulae PL171]